MKLHSLDDEISEINMTPFVDIVLVLLIIFMATASFVAEKAIKLNLPVAQNSSEVKEEDKKIRISINLDGKLYFNDNEIEIESLQKLLNEQKNELPIIISSDNKVEYGQIIRVIDICKESGFLKFALETRVNG